MTLVYWLIRTGAFTIQPWEIMEYDTFWLMGGHGKGVSIRSKE